MSVIMIVKVKGDAKKLESVSAENPDRMRGISDRAENHGLIAHRFYGSESGDEIMVIDEWPDAESFQKFFEEATPDIQSLMADADVTEQPQPTFWQKLETNDEVGWGS